MATADGDESSIPVPLPVATTTTIRAFDVELARVITQREEMKGLTRNEAECV